MIEFCGFFFFFALSSKCGMHEVKLGMRVARVDIVYRRDDKMNKYFSAIITSPNIFKYLI